MTPPLFTTRARNILSNALNYAANMRSDCVGVEHLLLALTDSKSSDSVSIHDSMVQACSEIHSQVQSTLLSGDGSGSRSIPQSQDAKQSIINAMELASEMKHTSVTSEHLFLGILALESNETLGSSLHQLELDKSWLRTELTTLAELDQGSTPPLPPNSD